MSAQLHRAQRYVSASFLIYFGVPTNQVVHTAALHDKTVRGIRSGKKPLAKDHPEFRQLFPCQNRSREESVAKALKQPHIRRQAAFLMSSLTQRLGIAGTLNCSPVEVVDANIIAAKEWARIYGGRGAPDNAETYQISVGLALSLQRCLEYGSAELILCGSCEMPTYYHYDHEKSGARQFCGFCRGNPVPAARTIIGPTADYAIS
ncbi:hypothetical protein [Halomonas sp. I5-271120]|uniref:hypothetical protein n=1 Tax=Halomonas sp. I5-271120 TaxID=3061632 RepID=UPI002715200A|nr:hypothetical protein [Halomonas sp. I5-271120]